MSNIIETINKNGYKTKNVTLKDLPSPHTRDWFLFLSEYDNCEIFEVEKDSITILLIKFNDKYYFSPKGSLLTLEIPQHKIIVTPELLDEMFKVFSLLKKVMKFNTLHYGQLWLLESEIIGDRRLSLAVMQNPELSFRITMYKPDSFGFSFDHDNYKNSLLNAYIEYPEYFSSPTEIYLKGVEKKLDLVLEKLDRIERK